MLIPYELKLLSHLRKSKIKLSDVHPSNLQLPDYIMIEVDVAVK